MANQQYLDLLKQSVETWNQYKKEHTDIYLDLSYANLSGADFSGADLSGADLTVSLQWHLLPEQKSLVPKKQQTSSTLL